MKLKIVDEENELMRTFREASKTVEEKHVTFRKSTATVKGGARHMSCDAYLKPGLRRRNLHVILNTQAISVS
jgi:hypothetical protein